MSNEKIYAWHFHNGQTLRDGSPLPAVGEKLVHDGPLKLCASGLHGSLDPVDALSYAPGLWLDLCLFEGKTLHQSDKLCSRERTPVQRKHVGDVIVRFAFACAWRAEAREARAAWEEARAAWAARAARAAREAARAAWAAREARAARAAREAVWAARAARAARAAWAAWAAERKFQTELFLAGLEAAGFDLTEVKG